MSERHAPEQITRDGQPLLTRGATVQGGASFNADKRTVPVSLGTGAAVLRYDWATDRNYIEVLSMDPSHVRLARMNGGAPFLTDHRQWSSEAVVGRFVKGSIRIENGELVGEVRLSRAKRHEDTVGDIIDGILSDTSVGYRVFRWEISRDEVSGIEVRTAVDWEPVEGSVVPVPADPTGGIRSAEVPTPAVVPSAPEAPAAADTRSDESNQQERKAMDEKQIEEARAEGARLEAARQDGIRSLAKKAGMVDEDIRALLADPKVTVEQAGVRMWDIKAERDKANAVEGRAVVTRDEGDTQFRAIASAVESIAGIAPLADNAQHLRGVGVAELARRNLAVKGIRADGLSKFDTVRMAMRAVAGHTTGDFSSVFANIGYKSLLGMYQLSNEYGWWKDLGRRVDFQNFNPRYIVRMGGLGTLPTVAEGATYQGATQYDGHEVITPTKKGAELRLTLEMAENDDLSAFTRTAAEFGKAAQVTEASMALAALTATMADGEAVCSAAHSNLVTSGGAPTIARISALDALLRNATDGNGHVIGTAGKVGLFPIAQRTVVEQLYSDKLFLSDPTNCPTVPLSADARRYVPGLTTIWFLCTGNPLAMEYGWQGGGPVVEQYAEEKSDSIIFHCRDTFGIGIVRYQDFAEDDGA